MESKYPIDFCKGLVFFGDVKMDRLELPEYDLPRYVTGIFIILFSFAMVSFYEISSSLSGNRGYMTWSIVVIFALLDLIFISSMFKKKSRYLLASIPPILVTESRWFGKFLYKKKRKLNEAAWVRVVYSSGEGYGNLDIEVGTQEHLTTTICLINYSKQNVAVAEKWSADIAHFLKLENKGSELGTPE